MEKIHKLATQKTPVLRQDTIDVCTFYSYSSYRTVQTHFYRLQTICPVTNGVDGNFIA